MSPGQALGVMIVLSWIGSLLFVGVLGWWLKQGGRWKLRWVWADESMMPSWFCRSR